MEPVKRQARYDASPNGKARKARYRATAKAREARRLAAARYRERHPEKRAARKAVWRALRDGKLARPQFCRVEACVKPPEAHHHDYAQPLVVDWLCRGHHRQLERGQSWSL